MTDEPAALVERVSEIYAEACEDIEVSGLDYAVRNLAKALAQSEAALLTETERRERAEERVAELREWAEARSAQLEGKAVAESWKRDLRIVVQALQAESTDTTEPQVHSGDAKGRSSRMHRGL